MFMTIIQVPTLIITTVFISLLKVSMKYLRPFSVLVNVYFRDDRKILLQILNAVSILNLNTILTEQEIRECFAY